MSDAKDQTRIKMSDKEHADFMKFHSCTSVSQWFQYVDERHLKEAGKTARVWLREGIEIIDNHFGKDYAQDNPQLLAGFMQSAGAARIDQTLSVLGQGLENLTVGQAEDMAGIIRAINELKQVVYMEL